MLLSFLTFEDISTINFLPNYIEYFTVKRHILLYIYGFYHRILAKMGSVKDVISFGNVNHG